MFQGIDEPEDKVDIQRASDKDEQPNVRKLSEVQVSRRVLWRLKLQAAHPVHQEAEETEQLRQGLQTFKEGWKEKTFVVTSPCMQYVDALENFKYGLIILMWAKTNN